MCCPFLHYVVQLFLFVLSTFAHKRVFFCLFVTLFAQSLGWHISTMWFKYNPSEILSGKSYISDCIRELLTTISTTGFCNINFQS